MCISYTLYATLYTLYTVPMDLHSLLTTGSYLAIFILMIANGAVNFPSSQFLYVICGYFVSTGSLLFIPTIIAGALGNTIGNIITFVLIKKYEKPLARKLLVMNEETFDKVHSALHATFARRGMWYIFFGKLIPSVKAFIPIIAGLANTKTNTTATVFLIASFIWATGITSLGYYFGEHASLASLSGISLGIGAVVAFFIYNTFSNKLAKKL
jgi:membrane protein DedA with SNARE-associated domain